MDIRSFFGGKPSQSSVSSQKEKKTPAKSTTPSKASKKRGRKVIGMGRVDTRLIVDSDEEDDDKCRQFV